MRSCLLAVMLGLLISSAIANGRQVIVISGKVVDSRSRLPLAFANIYLKDESSGTVSNTLGEFELKIASDHQHDTLVISFVGYQDKFPG